jgi:hypothetical protein
MCVIGPVARPLGRGGKDYLLFILYISASSRPAAKKHTDTHPKVAKATIWRHGMGPRVLLRRSARASTGPAPDRIALQNEINQ